MKVISFLLSLASLTSASCGATTYTSQTIFDPGSSYRAPRTLYARNAILQDGSVLATWENYSPEASKVYFPIYRSTDDGYTWDPLSNVTDTVNGWGLRYQPFLYVLPSAIGDYAAGDVLLAGSSIPSDLSKTQIELYGSKDAGKTWIFISNIAAGGKANPTNGQTPVWEPFLLMLNGQLICYYSDQRDSAYGQKVVHQTTTDLKTWSSVVNDVAVTPYGLRPGMPTLAKLPNGQWIMAYEECGDPGGCPIKYRIASSPTDMASAAPVQLKATDGTAPTSSPYVEWISYGGSSGTIMVSANSDGDIYINKALGAPDSWARVATPEPRAYARMLRAFSSNRLMLMGGGTLGGLNKVTSSMVDLTTVF